MINDTEISLTCPRCGISVSVPVQVKTVAFGTTGIRQDPALLVDFEEASARHQCRSSSRRPRPDSAQRMSPDP